MGIRHDVASILRMRFLDLLNDGKTPVCVDQDVVVLFPVTATRLPLEIVPERADSPKFLGLGFASNFFPDLNVVTFFQEDRSYYKCNAGNDHRIPKPGINIPCPGAGREADERQ